jgi:hypothetical protein
MVSIMTQEEMVEKETESLEKLTKMLKRVNVLLDRAKETQSEEGKRRLLCQAVQTMTRFE